MNQNIDRKCHIRAKALRSRKTYTEENAVLFLAKDEAFLKTLPDYRRHCEELGADENQLKTVDLLIKRVTRFQETHETKVPDVDPDLEASALEE